MNLENTQPETVVIKKYANRRLYNTLTSSYITLEGLSGMVRGGTDFVVYDARTGEDITRMILTQIIFEEEGRGINLLPIQFLRDLIRLYGQNMQNLVPNYLDMSMALFKKNQDHLQKTWSNAFGNTPAFKPMEDMMRQNMSLFEKTISIFNPFMTPNDKKEHEDDDTQEDKIDLEAMKKALQESMSPPSAVTNSGQKKNATAVQKKAPQSPPSAPSVASKVRK